VTQEIPRKKLIYERLAIFLGFVVAILLPVFFLGWKGGLDLLWHWKDALVARGLPLESHNQSFTALLHHYLSGHPTAVLSEGGQPLFFGHGWLSSLQITLIALCWSCLSVGFLLNWIIVGPRSQHPRSNPDLAKWIAVAIGALIVPSHLIWKPYFVMSLPLGVWMAQYAFRLVFRRAFHWGNIWILFFMVALFAGINMTGFDFVGHDLGAHFEAGSILLLMHVAMITFLLFEKNQGSSMDAGR
jgi:hypothetical protein